MFSTSLNNGATEKTGTIKIWSGATLPYGFLWCDGSEVIRNLYPELFDVIGTTYGAGDGTTTFNLPNAGSNSNCFTELNANNIRVFGNGNALGLIGNKSDGTVQTVSLITDSVGGLHSSTTAPEIQIIANNPSPKYNSFGVKNGSGFGVSIDASKSGIKGAMSFVAFKSKYIIKY